MDRHTENKRHQQSKEYTKDTWREARNQKVDYLNWLREQLDLDMQDITDALDKPENWYANRQRDKSSHEFSQEAYHETRAFLEISYLQELTQVSDDKLSSAIGLPGRSIFDSEDGLNIKRTTQSKIFLSAMLVSQEISGETNQTQVRNLVHRGVIDEQLYNDLHKELEL